MKFLNNMEWNAYLKDKKYSEAIFYPNYKFSYLIEEFFKRDKIDPKKFLYNKSKLNYSFEEQLMYSEKYENELTTPSINHFKEIISRPFFIPEWYLAAYPDLVYWFLEHKDNLSERNDYMALFNESDHEFEKGFMKERTLRLNINYYKKKISPKLECEYSPEWDKLMKAWEKKNKH